MTNNKREKFTALNECLRVLDYNDVSKEFLVELQEVAIRLKTELDKEAADLAAKRKACSHPNKEWIDTHPHRGDRQMRCPDCGLEWWD